LRSFSKNCKKSASYANFAKSTIFAKTINIAILKYLQLDSALNYIEQTYRLICYFNY